MAPVPVACDYGVIQFFFLLFFRTFRTSQETDGIVSRAKRDMRTATLIDRFHILRFPDHPHRRDNLLKIM